MQTTTSEASARPTLDERIAHLADSSRKLTGLAREVAAEGVDLLRHLLAERPVLVIGALAASAYAIARFGSARALGAAAAIGGQAASIAARPRPSGF